MNFSFCNKIDYVVQLFLDDSHYIIIIYIYILLLNYLFYFIISFKSYT